MPTDSLNLESQLLSIMDVLVKAAVLEISQLFSENSTSLRLHLSQSLRENETLRMRLKVMRSELFTLRLQTRINRPTGRFTPIRANTPKTRIKPNVVRTPAVVQKPVPDSAPSYLQPDSKTASPVKEESADVILINDEDDVGRCAPIEDENDFQGSQNNAVICTNAEAVGSSSDLVDNTGELRIVSVHGGGEGPSQEDSNLFFTASDLRGLSSLSSEKAITHDSFLNFTASDSAPGSGMPRNSQRNHSPQINVMKALTGIEGKGGHPSHISQLSPMGLQSPAKSLDCGFCGEHFLNREDFIAHRATHTGEQPTTCPMCGKSFVNKNTLTIHMRIHTGEKPYACGQCGKRFTQNGSLKIHLRTHSGEKPYSCTQCPASFNNPSNLRRHRITHNTNTLLGP
ncbi:uncharacterized protein ACB058_012031 [Synchiropus picturatus]